MTKQDVRKTITEFASKYGFKVEDGWGMSGIQIVDDTRTVNFFITEETKGDWENRKADITLTVNASIATMGGNPTGDELIQASKIIYQAGCLVNALASDHAVYKSLTYTETF